ncbi:MAG: zinc carboxypeptidase family protein [Hydrocarboniphaga sp.]|uniref:M14 family metallopeptidase n=1 Tax=Hydrocarboniphaga sp. TaxID=2033016 RepID=UPI00262BD1B0|nr:M14 family metallopeptidase [Hydrocarboniphaga sp.]MDB5968535.1 zinc carboxypeptidase family protein [Hydrocarboniphaga sp.]
MLKLRFSAVLFALAAAAANAQADLKTLSEKSGFTKTGRYDEVIKLCTDFAARWPEAVKCSEFGRTPEGRPMMLMIVSRSGVLTPEAAAAKHVPVMLIQGGIHAGEIDGKDAGFLALRDVLENKTDKGTLDKQVLLFVPVFNVDGHERFGAWNRPNQVGPEEMGWRTTAQNYNLNRDYMKADTPEMQAMLQLIDAWDPLVTADLHVTDGAKFQHDVSITIEPVYSGDEALRSAGIGLRGDIIKQLSKKGSLPLPFYPSFVVDDDPASGFADNVPSPRFSNGYFALRNRFGVLVETHSWKDYKTRVRITRNTIDALLDLMAQHGDEWLRLTAAADMRAIRLKGPVPLSWKPSDKTRTIDFRGYVYTRTLSDVSGALMTRYDERKPQVWQLPMRDDVQPLLSVDAPGSGYIVPAAQAAWMKEKFALHDIVFQVLDQDQPPGPVQTFRATAVRYAKEPFENHMGAEFDGEWQPETRAVPAGSLFVPIHQPKARLLMSLLEPRAPDSYAAWGFFNIAFEQKEYMEAYVAEDVARAQLAKDPALAAEFQKKLADDPAFAADPRARLTFFARRAPSWDERLNLYPVMRVD